MMTIALIRLDKESDLLPWRAASHGINQMMNPELMQQSTKWTRNEILQEKMSKCTTFGQKHAKHFRKANSKQCNHMCCASARKKTNRTTMPKTIQSPQRKNIHRIHNKTIKDIMNNTVTWQSTECDTRHRNR